MAISDISLTIGMKDSLFSLKSTSARIDRTQERLATGKKVNSSLDNPTNFFASRTHLDRASDLDARKDGMAEAIKTGEAANAGLKAITSLIDTARAIANSAYTVPPPRTEQSNLFNGILKQIDNLAKDSGYRGLNLLKNDELTVVFNENGSSTMTIEGVNAASGALGVSEVGYQGSTIAIGESFSLALKDDGSVIAWGDSSYGATTVPAAAQSGVVAVAANNRGALALKDDGSVVAWGENIHGTTNVPAAAQSGVVAVSAGIVHSMALKDDGSVIAWGSNLFGETTIPADAQTGVVAIAAGDQLSVALKSDGSVVAWGLNDFGQANVPAAAQSGVTAISACGRHVLALKSDGSVVAWGWNDHGETAIPAAAQSGVVAIAAGDGFSLALKNDGSVIAWGSNYAGETVIPAAALSGVTAIAASNSHALALKSNGSVIAWGANWSGETTVPAAARSGVMQPSPSWSTDAGIITSEKQLETAMGTIRSNAASLSSTLSAIAVRQTFTRDVINTLQTGSDNLTLADMNEEAANMLMLQTRQNLGITSLGMASQASQAVMRLFG